MDMMFLSRESAGQELGQRLLEQGVKPDIVLGLPRGGVVVAAEVARILRCPLDVLVVRKIGHPRQREFAVGALAEPDVVLLDRRVVKDTDAADEDLREIILEETERLEKYRSRFHRGSGALLEDKVVMIVDDGLATGATTEAAVLSAKKQKARRVMVATPVASSSAAERLRPVADKVYALAVDPEFAAVGQYYEHFPQTTDEEVLAVIHSHA